VIGGTNVDNQSVKNNDPIQLQQMIIFLRAELAKYKNEINRLRDSDYYSLVLRLERENVQLTKRNKELAMDRMKLKRTNERELKAYNEDIQRREIQRKKHISSIDTLLREIEHLRSENKELRQTTKANNNELLTIKRDYVAEEKQAIESLEIQLSTFTKAANEKMNAIIEAIQRNDENNVHDYLVKELAERDNEINRLSFELMDIKNKSTSAVALNGENTSVNSKVLLNLDAKIQKIIAQSNDFEEQLEKKVRILDDLEHQLTQLAIEINVNRSM
jgi:chromosome segregation ATPase